MATTFQPGQKVMVTHPERGAVEAEVSKVGRTLVYASHWAFHVDTGVERRGSNAAGYAYRLRTLEQYADDLERIRLLAALSQAGIKFQFADFYVSKFTTSQMKRLLDVATDTTDES